MQNNGAPGRYHGERDSDGARARCVSPRYRVGRPYLRLAGSAVKKRTRLDGGPFSHVRTPVRPARAYSTRGFAPLSLSSHAQPYVVLICTLCSLSFSPSLSLSLAHIPPISLFLRGRHTRRLIKSATKSSAHYRRTENGPLTDSPHLPGVPARPPSSLFLVTLHHPSRATFFRSSAAMFLPAIRRISRVRRTRTASRIAVRSIDLSRSTITRDIRTRVPLILPSS